MFVAFREAVSLQLQYDVASTEAEMASNALGGERICITSNIEVNAQNKMTLVFSSHIVCRFFVFSSAQQS